MGRVENRGKSDALTVKTGQIGTQPAGVRCLNGWNTSRKGVAAVKSTPFTSRHISATPLAEMPALRFERAPLLVPEYRGVTPRAALHRRMARQTMLLALYEISVRGSTVTHTDSDEPAREPPIWPWSVGSLLFLTTIVVLCAIGSALF